jgi:release factor glutamine methyltransferase
LNISEAFNYGSKTLFKSGLSQAKFDAKLLIKNQLGINDEDFIRSLNTNISNSDFEAYKLKIQRRMRHEPIAHITGIKDFWKNTFYVTKDTLIPRPDSETLIESIKKHIPTSNDLNLLDLGTGSGCLIISALEELKYCHGTGIDISENAISIAIKNKEKINKNLNLSFYVNDFFSFDTNGYDVIICNPPYVSEADKNEIKEEVMHFEPHLALFPKDGTKDCYEKIVKNIISTNDRKCYVFFEIDYRDSILISNILKDNHFSVIAIENDLTNRPRCIVSKMN